MGIECFCVELGGTSASSDDVLASLRALEGCERDELSEWIPEQVCFVVRRENLTAELEVLPGPRVSCRMTLCHPPTSDGAFVGLLGDLSARLSTDRVRRIDGVSNAASLDQLALDEETREAIARKRARWKRQFGDAEGCYSSLEVHRLIIGPRTVPAERREAERSERGTA